MESQEQAEEQVNETASVSNEKLKSARLELNDGNTIPTIGLGTFLKARTVKFFRDTEQKLSAEQLEQDKKDDEKEENAFKEAIITAVKYGYRHIDSAQAYRTETIIGEALQELYAANIIKREDIFITSKVPRNIRQPSDIRNSIEKSLQDLQMSYIDLYLIHSAHSMNDEGSRGHDVIELYKILHEYKAQGKIRSVGVSNFGISHLEILENACPDLALPVCNQIECHPFLQENEIINYCKTKGILISSFSPIAQAKDVVQNNEILREMGQKYKKAWSQIMLRWQVQKGFVLLPKSVTAQRIISNGDIFDFEISQQDMDTLDALAKENIRVCWNVLDLIWDDTYNKTKDCDDDNKIDVYVNKLKENLENRAGKKTLEDKNILVNSAVADSLQANAKSLQQQQKKDKLKQGMSDRKEEKELYDAGIKKNKGVADSLQDNVSNLEREQKKDKLKKGMRKRSDSNTLAERNILPNQAVADSLQATAKTLEAKQKKDKLKQFFEVEEVTEETLYDKGIKKNKGVADSLQANTESLIKEQKKDTLNNAIKNRSDTSDLKNRGILKNNNTGGVDYDDAELEEETQNIISSLTDDELNRLKRTLETDIKENNEAYDPQIYVYLNGIIGGGTGGELANDEDYDQVAPMSPNTRKIMDDIHNEHDQITKKRDSQIEMETVQQALQSNFSKHDDNNQVLMNGHNEMDKKTKKKKLKENLDKRPNKEQLKQQNILKADITVVSSKLQQNAVALSQQQKKDKLKQSMAERKEEKELYDAGIKKNKGVADALQSTVDTLEKQQNKDKLRFALDSRSTVKELKEKGFNDEEIVALIQLKQENKETEEKNQDLKQETKQQQVIIGKLQEIIQRKAKEIEAMKHIHDKQSQLIQNMNQSTDEKKNEYDNESENKESDREIEQCLQILGGLNNAITAFQVNYNKIKVNEIGNANIDDLVNPNSIFNGKLDKYSQIINAINICSNNFKKEIIGIKKYVYNKFIPNSKNYKKWELADIILWIKSLENGRFIKYLSVLSKGFIESEICGEELPDLSTADLSVTPFNIKIFKDKRDLIKHFTRLRIAGDIMANQNENKNKNENENEGTDIPALVGRDTNEVVQAIKRESLILDEETQNNDDTVKQQYVD